MSYWEIGWRKVECIQSSLMFKEINEFVPCFGSKRIGILNKDFMFWKS